MFKFEAFFAFWPRENLDGAQKMGGGGKGREQKYNHLPTPPICCLALILVPPKEKNASKLRISLRMRKLRILFPVSRNEDDMKMGLDYVGLFPSDNVLFLESGPTSLDNTFLRKSLQWIEEEQ